MRIYDSIENIPVFNYYKIVDTREYKYLLHEGVELKKVDSKELQEAWDKIIDEVNEKSMQDAKNQQKIRSQKRSLLRRIKAAISEKALDRLIADAEEEKETDNDTGFDYHKSIAILESKIGQINDRTMTMARYMTHMDILKEGLNNGAKSN